MRLTLTKCEHEVMMALAVAIILNDTLERISNTATLQQDG